MVPNIFDYNMDHVKLIPWSWPIPKYYSMTLEGWPSITFVHDESDLENILIFAHKFFDSFIEIYKEECAFTAPVLSFQPHNKTFCFKIGVMPIEEYNSRMEKSNLK